MKGQDHLKFKAFISYSHAADVKLAPALQQPLRDFAKLALGSAVCVPRKARMFRALSLLFVVFWSIACAISVAFAKNDDCDPGLEQPKENPYGYRLRGDRYEGI